MVRNKQWNIFLHCGGIICVFVCVNVVCVFTSEVHLVSRCSMCLLFTLVTRDCDVLERAPVLFVALQRQFFRSGLYV